MKKYFRYIIPFAFVFCGFLMDTLGVVFSDGAATISGAIFLCTGANMFFSLLK